MPAEQQYEFLTGIFGIIGVSRGKYWDVGRRMTLTKIYVYVFSCVFWRRGVGMGCFVSLTTFVVSRRNFGDLQVRSQFDRRMSAVREIGTSP
jgi:hypothetical protein